MFKILYLTRARLLWTLTSHLPIHTRAHTHTKEYLDNNQDVLISYLMWGYHIVVRRSVPYAHT